MQPAPPDYSNSSDRQLTQLGARWDKLSAPEKEALLREVKMRMAQQKDADGVLMIRTQRRYGRVYRGNGHYLKIEFRKDAQRAEIRERRYWDLDFPDAGQEEDPADSEKLIDDFEATFQRAVEIRLRADVPVVGYLSGGVDSAYVLANAFRRWLPEGAAIVVTDQDHEANSGPWRRLAEEGFEIRE